MDAAQGQKFCVSAALRSLEMAKFWMDSAVSHNPQMANPMAKAVKDLNKFATTMLVPWTKEKSFPPCPSSSKYAVYRISTCAHRISTRAHRQMTKTALFIFTGQSATENLGTSSPTTGVPPKHLPIKVDGRYKCKCPACGKICSKSNDYKSHYRKEHMDQKWACLDCGMEFTEERSLTRHLKGKEHLLKVGELKTYPCDYCKDAGEKPEDYVFTTEVRLTTHIHRKHPKKAKERFICELCGKSFPTRGYLAKHAAACDKIEKDLKCGSCGKMFKSKNGLEGHILQAHSGQSPFQCAICDRVLSSGKNLQLHLKAHEVLSDEEAAQLTEEELEDWQDDIQDAMVE